MSKDVCTIVICDDHPLFRAGVASCFAGIEGAEIVAEAADGEACIAKLKLFRPDVLIADLSTPGRDGFQVLEWATREMPHVRVFIVSMHAGAEYVERSRELGAAGFITKEDAQSELVTAVCGKRSGFFTSLSVGRPASALTPALHDEAIRQSLGMVSDAEMRVLLLLTENLTSREIAGRLNLSPRTVQAHRVSIADKLGAKGSNKLLEIAIRFRDAIRNHQR